MADPRPISSDTQDLIAALAASGGGGAGGNSVAMPATQKYGLVKADQAKGATSAPEAGVAPPGFVWIVNPNYIEKAPAAKPAPVGSADTGWFAPDPSNPAVYTQVIPAHTPNADDEIKKYLDRAQSEQLRTQRERNDASGFGYATDDEVIKRSNESQQLGINKADSVLKYKTLDENQRQFDIKQKTEDATAAQNILQSKAQTGLIGANTQQVGAQTAATTQTTEQNAQLFPTTLEQARATLAGTQQSTAASQQTVDASKQAMQIAGAPQVQTPPTGMSQWTRDPKTGVMTQGPINPEWQPKTLADVNARVGQLQGLANQKKQELLGKAAQSGGAYTNDQAVSDFHNWWDQNVAPQSDVLKAAQAQAIAEQQRLDQTQRQQAMQTALGASAAATNAFTASQAGRVGANFDEANAAASRGDFAALAKVPGGGTGYTAPDINQTAQQAVMDALKNISPTAAAATGGQMPNYGAVDIPTALNATNYGFGGGAPQPAQTAGAIAAPPPPPAPGGPDTGLLPPGAAGVPGVDPRLSGQLNPLARESQQSTYDWNALFGRLGNADVRGQAVAAMGQNPYVYGG